MYVFDRGKDAFHRVPLFSSGRRLTGKRAVGTQKNAGFPGLRLSLMGHPLREIRDAVERVPTALNRCGALASEECSPLIIENPEAAPRNHRRDIAAAKAESVVHAENRIRH